MRKKSKIFILIGLLAIMTVAIVIPIILLRSNDEEDFGPFIATEDTFCKGYISDMVWGEWLDLRIQGIFINYLRFNISHIPKIYNDVYFRFFVKAQENTAKADVYIFEGNWSELMTDTELLNTEVYWEHYLGTAGSLCGSLSRQGFFRIKLTNYIRNATSKFISIRFNSIPKGRAIFYSSEAIEDVSYHWITLYNKSAIEFLPQLIFE